MPETREENKRFLTLKEIPVVLGKLPFREQLIFRISLVLGLRPGELFALRWDDIDGYSLRLDESTVDGEVYPSLKTEKIPRLPRLAGITARWSGRMEKNSTTGNRAGIHFSECRWRRTSTGQLQS